MPILRYVYKTVRILDAYHEQEMLFLVFFSFPLFVPLNSPCLFGSVRILDKKKNGSARVVAHSGMAYVTKLHYAAPVNYATKLM